MSGSDRVGVTAGSRRWLPARIWALWAASRPSQLALIALVYALGVGTAAAGRVVEGGPDGVDAGVARTVGYGLVALIPTAVAIHYANEYADVETDSLTESTPFSGGSGALVETGLPRSFLGRATAVASAVAVLVGGGALAGGVLAADAGALLAVVFLFGLAYSLPPVALVDRGVGEFVNATLGGLVLPVYGVAVVATPTVATPLVTLPFALVVGCSLLCTHWPDRDADAAVGKRTLAVRWPPARIRRLYAALAGLAAATTVALLLAGVLPGTVAAAHIVAVPFLLWGGRTLTRRRSPLPAVTAMVALAAATSVAWWWLAL